MALCHLPQSAELNLGTNRVEDFRIPDQSLPRENCIQGNILCSAVGLSRASYWTGWLTALTQRAAGAYRKCHVSADAICQRGLVKTR